MTGPRFLLRSFQSVTTAMEMQDQLQEYVQFQAGMVRRQAQVFQAASSKFSFVFSVLIGWLSMLLLAHGALMLLELFERTHPNSVQPVLGPQLREGLFKLVPRFDAQITTLVVIFEAYLFTRLRRLRNWLGAKDSRPHAKTL